MLLEKEIEELCDWFQKTYPGGKISAHAGYDKRDKHEEYNITFQINGKHFHASPLRIPPGSENQPVEFVNKFRSDYLEVQKKKIREAYIGSLS